MEIPSCPDPAHADGQVVRAGWYGKAPHRRQRWLCRPTNGDSAHRFAEALPRQQAAHPHCLECSTHLEAWEGQSGPRRYNFTAREIAHALKLVAGGASYRTAAGETRLLAHRKRQPRPKSIHPRSLKRDPNLDGQIVRNWVDVFAADLIGDTAPLAWPKTILVDAVNFRINTGIKFGMGFYVFAAISYEQLPGSFVSRPVVVHMQAFGRKDTAAWKQFFRALSGTPQTIITDMDPAARLAARQVFPRASDPAPELRMCEWHLKRSIETNLALLKTQPAHPVWSALERAFYSPQDWARFEREVETVHTSGAPRLVAMMRWLKKNSKHVQAQVATRTSAGPHSIAAVDATLHKIEKAFENNRSSVFGNQQRMNLLLGLMTAELRDQANELDWAARIRQTLAPRLGVADFQRPHDDSWLAPSLVA